MTKKTLLLLLVLLSLIPLSGFSQASKQQDTVRCYNLTELRIIARTLVEGKECSELLKIANDITQTQDTVIVSLQQTVIKQDDRYIKTNHLVTLCESEKDVLKKDLKKAKRRLIWVKVAWAATAVALTVTTVLALLL